MMAKSAINENLGDPEEDGRIALTLGLLIYIYIYIYMELLVKPEI
jgi:hypothetical protein